MLRNLLLGSNLRLLTRRSQKLSSIRRISFKTNAALNAGRFVFPKQVRNFSSCRILRQTASADAAATASLSAQRLLSSRRVGFWLIGTSGLVFGIVILGGLTRLTESGLSITEWKPVTGTLPPLNQQQWEEEFAKYKKSPEFQQLNSNMDLDDFKFIFFMEWFHRLWGRSIGAVFILPAVYFAMTKKTTPHVNKRLFGLSLLLGLQGVIGWWMVYSGLDQEQLDARKSKPTVSQYRLTTHLGAAFALYMGMIWTGFTILKENKWAKNPAQALEMFKKLGSTQMDPVRKISLFLLGLSFLTAMSGGMVAGLDAGLVYNTFPKMGDTWLPSSRELMDDNFARAEDKSDKFWRNMFENPTTVQLNHRILALTTFTAVLWAHLYCSKRKAFIPKNANTMMHAMMGIVTLQCALGIFTLLWIVPVPLAACHQGGALALFTSAILFAAQLRKPRAPIMNCITMLSKTKTVNGTSKILNEIKSSHAK